MRTIVSLVCLAVGLAPQPQTLATGIIVHDLASKGYDQRGSMQLKAVVTDDGSVAVAIVPAGAKQAPHHHEQEQVVLNLDGGQSFTIGESTYSLPPLTAALPSSNTRHNYTVDTNGPATFIEYQPIRRDDYTPPFTGYTAVLTPEPVPAAKDLIGTRDLSAQSEGWQANGSARTKELTGGQCRIVMMDLRSPGAGIDVAPSPNGRQFLYVLSGQATLTAGGANRQLSPHMVVEMTSASTPIRLQSVGAVPTLIAAFSRVRR